MVNLIDGERMADLPVATYPGGVLKLYESLERLSPAHTLVLVPDEPAKQWVRRQLADCGGPLVGVEVASISGFANEVEQAALGDPVPNDEITGIIHECFAGRDMFGALFAEGPKSAAARSWIAGLISIFAELHRALGNLPVPTGIENCRDRQLLEGFVQFRQTLTKINGEGWWAGNAPTIAARYFDDMPLTRDLRAVFLFGFSSGLNDTEGTGSNDLANKPTWMPDFLNQLCTRKGRQLTEILSSQPVAPAALDCEPGVMLACQSPEAEIAEIARIIRRDRKPTTIFVPAPEISRWASRLQHRDIPVRARVPHPMNETAVLRMLRALSRLAAGGLVHKSDMAEILFGQSLRAVKWGIHEGAEDDVEQPAIYPNVRKIWQEIRRRNLTLAGWKNQIAILQARRERQWKEADEDEAPTERDLQRRKTETEAGGVLIRCIELLRAAMESVQATRDLMKAWKLIPSARANREFGQQEISAASELMSALEAGRKTPLKQFLDSTYQELDLRNTGYWIDQYVPNVAAGTVSRNKPAFVSVVPYEAACIDLPERVILCGLDSMPARRGVQSFFSQETLSKLKIPGEHDRYIAECNRLGRLTSVSDKVLSWRTKDSQGGATTPSAWVISNFPVTREGAVTKIGLDSVALPNSRYAAERNNTTAPCCELEKDLSQPQSVLAGRVSAILTHYKPEEPGPWSGSLGIGYVPPHYSVTALQSYTRMPYQFFLQKVLGLAEEDDAEDSADSAEQGTVLHDSLELSAKNLLAKQQPVDVTQKKDALVLETDETFGRQYEGSFNDLLATPVWKGESARWSTELRKWWDDFYDRLEALDSSGQDEVADWFRPLTNGTFDGWIRENRFKEFKDWTDELLGKLRTKPVFGYTSDGKCRTFESTTKEISSWLEYLATAEDPVWRNEEARKNFGTRKVKIRRIVDAAVEPGSNQDDGELLKNWKSGFAEYVNGFKKLLSNDLKLFASYAVVCPWPMLVAVEMPLGTAETHLNIRLADDLSIPIKGSIDRVELDPQAGLISICDYKSGHPKTSTALAKEIIKGEHLQLPLYAVAIESMPENTKPGCGSAPVGAFRLEALKRDSKGSFPECALSPTDTPEGTTMTYVEVAKWRAAQIVKNIQTGLFPLCASQERTIQSSRESEILRVVYVAEPQPLSDGSNQQPPSDKCSPSSEVTK